MAEENRPEWKIEPICGSDSNFFVYRMNQRGDWYYSIKVFNFIFVLDERLKAKKDDSPEVKAKKLKQAEAAEKQARKEFDDRIQKYIRTA